MSLVATGQGNVVEESVLGDMIGATVPRSQIDRRDVDARKSSGCIAGIRGRSGEWLMSRWSAKSCRWLLRFNYLMPNNGIKTPSSNSEYATSDLVVC